MNTMPESNGSGTPGVVPINALPDLPPMEVAENRIAELEHLLRGAVTELSQSREACRLYAEKLAEIEKNPLSFTLAWLEGGTTAKQAGEALADLTSDVLRLSSKGKLTLEFGVKAQATGAVTITGKIKVSKPVVAPQASIFYLGDDGKLQRNDPKQLELRGLSRADRSDPADRDPYADETERLQREREERRGK